MPSAIVVLTMAVAQLFDLATFVTMVHRLGPRAEANPIVSAVLGSDGLPVVVLTKVALVVLVGAVSFVLLTEGARSRRLAQVLLASAIVAGLIGGWSNALTMGAL